MEVNQTLVRILDDYYDKVRAGNDIVIAFIDGVVFLEKGKSINDPINIKIEPFDKKIEKTIKEVFHMEE
ncbi:hypothetical protein AC623_20345 [Bacillus sp. FJAT-27231]|uniref:hypothetical protein n=1 Tax=Bacillus sp. FJAT-27231 TaxID=1679168 RepID=UPI0006714212|nr:hypothetical protein [Bacillus sp. FJAT-27231]KMY52496.1 hypothetical protein AC623_20345 [Bacillus sp. FJAT-27231]